MASGHGHFDAARLAIQYRIRVAMLGEAGVGKTSLLLRYTDDVGGMTDLSQYMLDMRTKMIIRNGHLIKLEVQDTAGLERYRSLTKSHYKAITGAMILFDLTKEATFQRVMNWHEELQNNVDKSIVVLLVGTNCHKKDTRQVPESRIKQLADNLDAQYLEVSAAQNINVDLCFETLVDKILERNADKVKVQGKDRMDLGAGVMNNRELWPSCCAMSRRKELDATQGGL